MEFRDLFSENCGLNIVEREEEERVMRAALQELPDPLLVAVVMRYTQVYSTVEISLRTGIPEDRVIGLTEAATHMLRNKVQYDYARLSRQPVTLPPLDSVTFSHAAVSA